MKQSLLVIGGGPAGVTAALTAVRNGIPTTLLEATPRLMNKLRITGKGRCNLTNAHEGPDFLAHIVHGDRFFRSAFSQFDNHSLMQMMESLGVPLKVEQGQRVFPADDRAHSIADALARALKEAGVQVVLKARIRTLDCNDGRITAVHAEDGRSFSAAYYILATGGASYPVTGSRGDGYILARACNHTITDIRPSLAPIATQETWVRDVQGLSLKNVRLCAFEGGKKVFAKQGEMLFTASGISGPLVLSATAHLRTENGVLSIDWKPALQPEQLDARLLNDFKEQSNRSIKTVLNGYLPRSMVPVFLALAQMDADKPCHQVNKKERASLVRLFKDCPLHVKRIGPIEAAIVTSGGVSLKEVDPKRMKSKLVDNLSFAGEVLDLDAYTGGYNLQIAFSTGFAAGKHCAIIEA